MRVTIPTYLSEIKLSQYLRYQKVIADNSDDETFVCIQMVAIFCNLTVAEVMKIPVNDFSEIVETLAKVLDQKPALVRTFKLNKVVYGFIPNFEKISLGEHATIDTLLGKDENLALLISVMYRKVTKMVAPFYEIEEYDGDESKAELFKDVPMDVVIGSMLFLEFKQGIIEQYTIAFGEQSNEGGTEFGGSFGERWGWYQTFIRLSRELRIHVREIGREPLHESLTLLSYLIDESKEEAKQIKQNFKK